MPTLLEIEELKRQWRNDPSWDLETTTGFEQHHDELLEYRQHMQAFWKTLRDTDLAVEAAKLGAPLAESILRLEQNILELRHRIERLEERVSALEERVSALERH